MTLVLTSDQALENSRRGAACRRHPGTTDPRHVEGMLFPHLTPAFRLEAGMKVFTVGSCFARNIEEELPGFDLPTRGLALSAEDVEGRPNSSLNEFTPAGMAQRLGWALEGRATAAIGQGYAGDDSAAIDLLLAKGRPRPRGRLAQIRGMIDAVYAALAGSDALIVTLGLQECWRDAETGLWLNRMPDPRDIRRTAGRYELHLLDAEASVAMLAPVLAGLIETGLRRVLITVSPVPMTATFSGQDCVIANSRSKAEMRLTADLLARRFAGVVDYFPSYEMVLSVGPGGLAPDLIHVRGEVVARVMDHLRANYLVQEPTSKEAR